MSETIKNYVLTYLIEDCIYSCTQRAKNPSSAIHKVRKELRQKDETYIEARDFLSVKEINDKTRVVEKV